MVGSNIHVGGFGWSSERTVEARLEVEINGDGRWRCRFITSRMSGKLYSS